METGEVIGYQITCGRHTNVHDDIPCAKHLALGTDPATRPTPEECMRRLKRWYITAKQVEHSWDPDTCRDMHIRQWGIGHWAVGGCGTSPPVKLHGQL